ncbi:hypothetical protein R3P38DRAFT_3485059 [Favolaschia claudopus]|uniref:F-box domain-containing protein n=1 Tax=Favolaschia claudopus TaxID=2862362 RepID=A0AAW0CDI5_9AGAR
MLDLPFDLQDLILSLLENTDIWALSQTSHSFRQLTTATLLAQYDISMSQVHSESGSIRLTEKAAVIIPTIHRVQHIKKLAMIPEPPHWEEWRLLRPLRRLPAILACISPTPEVEIHSDTLFYAGHECIGHLLEVLSQGDPIVIIKSGNIFVSSPYTPSHLRTRFAAWRNGGESARRIADDIKNVCGSLNVKTVLSGTKSQFTLAAFDFISGSSPVLNIGPIALLSSPQLSALLAALYVPHLSSLRIQADAGLHYRTLLQFIARHKRLESFALERGAIDARSLYPTANLSLSTHTPDPAPRITMLTCAAQHIRNILPTQPGIMHLTLICPPDGLELSSALNHIAFSTTNPDMHQPTLDFTATHSVFPWLNAAPFFPANLADGQPLRRTANNNSLIVSFLLRIIRHKTMRPDICLNKAAFRPLFSSDKKLPNQAPVFWPVLSHKNDTISHLLFAVLRCCSTQKHSSNAEFPCAKISTSPNLRREARYVSLKNTSILSSGFPFKECFQTFFVHVFGSNQLGPGSCRFRGHTGIHWMRGLPTELLCLLFQFLDDKDLWNVFHTSRFFQQLALFPFLARHGFTKAVIFSGNIQIPDEKKSYLIPIISRIHPIDRLTISSSSYPPSHSSVSTLLSNSRLVDAITAIPSLTELTIQSRIPSESVIKARIATLVSTLSRDGVDPVFLVGLGRIEASRYTRRRPFPTLRFRPTENEVLSLGQYGVSESFNFLGYLLFAVFLWIQNLYHICIWLLGLLALGPRWTQTMRIERALGDLPRLDSLHIKTVSLAEAEAPHERFTLVTFHGGPWGLYIPNFPSNKSGFSSESKAQFYTALLNTVDLKDQLTGLSISPSCAIPPGVLRAFLGRHRNLRLLALEEGCLDDAALDDDAGVDVDAQTETAAAAGGVIFMVLPAAYVPWVLPSAPAVEELSITINDHDIKTQAEDAHASALAVHVQQPSRGSDAQIALYQASGPSRGAAAATRNICNLLEISTKKPTLTLTKRRRRWKDFRACGSSAARRARLRQLADRQGLPRWLARCSLALYVVEFKWAWALTLPEEERDALCEDIQQARMEAGRGRLEVKFLEG